MLGDGEVGRLLLHEELRDCDAKFSSVVRELRVWGMGIGQGAREAGSEMGLIVLGEILLILFRISIYCISGFTISAL